MVMPVEQRQQAFIDIYVNMYTFEFFQVHIHTVVQVNFSTSFGDIRFSNVWRSQRDRVFYVSLQN